MRKPSVLHEEKLREPEMPDIKVPKDFLDKVVQNNVDVERFEKKVKEMKRESDS